MTTLQKQLAMAEKRHTKLTRLGKRALDSGNEKLSNFLYDTAADYMAVADMISTSITGIREGDAIRYGEVIELHAKFAKLLGKKKFLAMFDEFKVIAFSAVFKRETELYTDSKANFARAIMATRDALNAEEERIQFLNFCRWMVAFKIAKVHTFLRTTVETAGAVYKEHVETHNRLRKLEDAAIRFIGENNGKAR